jgi:hypothetical protein
MEIALGALAIAMIGGSLWVLGWRYGCSG